MPSCIHCGISRAYYSSDEHASRQSCSVSDSGYHNFQSLGWCLSWFRRKSTEEKLLQRRRQKRPHTI